MSRSPVFNKHVISYGLYDWASSPMPTLHATFVFAVYFTTTVMPEGGTVAWSQMTALAAFIVAFLSPFTGAMADRHAMRKTFLMVVTAIGVVSGASLWLIKPDPSYAAMAIIISAINIVMMELAFVFYNALLPGISTKENMGKVSGFSWGVGYIGAIACLALALAVFVLPETPPFGLDKNMAEHVRVTMPLAAIWLLLFSLPLFLFVPEGKKAEGSFMTTLKEGWFVVRKTPGLLRFLIARVFYADALVTLFAFGGIFAAKVFGFAQTDVLIFAILLNITAGIGAIFGGWADDRLGAITTIRLSLIALVLAGTIIILSSSAMVFWVIGGVLGVFVGPVQSASRSHVARMSPPGTEARVFGFMMLTGKATAFIGPLLYGWIVLASGQERYGMAVVIVLLMIGLMLLKSAPRDAKT
ncbi:MAG: MFS transporter [Alphaproteobacteria bacterium]|nr:MFS transporter [Alphaproteobacteria bacterium]